jgi:hypothetical protein
MASIARLDDVTGSPASVLCILAMRFFRPPPDPGAARPRRFGCRADGLDSGFGFLDVDGDTDQGS